MIAIRQLGSFLTRKLSWYRVKLFGKSPAYNAGRDPVLQNIVERQNKVVETCREKLGEDKGRLLEELLRQSWASPEDFEEKV